MRDDDRLDGDSFGFEEESLQVGDDDDFGRVESDDDFGLGNDLPDEIGDWDAGGIDAFSED